MLLKYLVPSIKKISTWQIIFIKRWIWWVWICFKTRWVGIGLYLIL